MKHKKVWVTRDKGTESDLVFIWFARQTDKPPRFVSDTGKNPFIRFGGVVPKDFDKYNYYQVNDFSKLFGYTPTKGSCQFKALNNVQTYRERLNEQCKQEQLPYSF